MGNGGPREHYHLSMSGLTLLFLDLRILSQEHGEEVRILLTLYFFHAKQFEY